MTTEYPERSGDLSRDPDPLRDPDPPARATEVDKQEPATPDSAPEPVAPEVESARLLANQARPVLGAEGFDDERIDELASAFIAKDIGEGVGIPDRPRPRRGPVVTPPLRRARLPGGHATWPATSGSLPS